MIGVVELYKNDEKFLEESNMVLDNTGELIVDMLTMMREISSVPGASAILDTSNYTVRAASLGKDAAGYNYHGHFSALQVLSDDVIRVISFEENYVSAYHTSAFAEANNIAILPEASNPKMTRLESESTAVSGLYDYGHNLNKIAEDKIFGCYAPAGNFKFYIVTGTPLDATSNVVVSALLNNTKGLNTFSSPSAIDSRGFIVNTVNSMVSGKALETAKEYRGLLLSYDSGWDDGTEIRFVLGIEPQDLIVLNAYGGIYNIGLWGIDIRKMLDKGMLPPYNLGASDDMEYRLLARKTFTTDITYYQDDGATAGILALNDTLKIVWRWVF